VDAAQQAVAFEGSEVTPHRLGGDLELGGQSGHVDPPLGLRPSD
jgi:hypothetical protein